LKHVGAIPRLQSIADSCATLFSSSRASLPTLSLSPPLRPYDHDQLGSVSRRHHPRSPRVRTRRPHDHLPQLRLRCTRRCTASSPSSNSGRIVLHLPLYPLLRSQMPLLRSSRSLSILLRRTVSPHLSLIPGCDVVDDGVRTWSRGTTGRVNRSLLPPTHPTLLPSLHSCTRVGWGARTSRSLRSRT
jgi:hypothetical protein